MSILNALNVDKGNAFPLGVVQLAHDKIQIAMWKSGAKACHLCLHLRGKVRKIKMYAMKDLEMSDIFSVILSAENIDDLLKDVSYDFIIDGERCMDPFAKALSGRSVFGKPRDHVRCRFELNTFDWTGENWHKLKRDEMVIYQCHVRGFTRHASSGVKYPGTFAGMMEKIPYFKELGVNTLFLLPIYDFNECMRDDEGNYTGKINYWGYTADAFYLAPKMSYCSGQTSPTVELQKLVKALHQNGMNLILDMYMVGQTPEFILHCLRYYATFFHVDGFRINQDSMDCSWLEKDPMLSHIKIIGNGWENVSQTGNTEVYYEMNDGFMVDARRYLKSDEGQTGNFYQRFKEQREGVGQIHYITHNNGFTLRDLISYDVKHNEANGERNMDGTQYNYSWNCGYEGKTRRKQVLRMRAKQEKNAFVMLLLGMAVPMLLAGDEFGNSQKGNNNAYCQDNLTTWLDWRLLEKNRETFEFAKSIIAFRKKHPLYHQDRKLTGMDYSGRGAPDVSCHGHEPWVTDFSYYSRELGILFYGGYYESNSLYFAFNFHWDEHEFYLPVVDDCKKWRVLIDTSTDVKKEIEDGKCVIPPRTIMLFESICSRPEKSDRKKNYKKRKKR